MTRPTLGPVRVEVRPEVAPDGQLMVLLQLPYGYALVQPGDARWIAGQLTEVADEVEAGAT